MSLKGNSTRGIKGPGDTPNLSFTVPLLSVFLKVKELSRTGETRVSPGLVPTPWALQKQSKQQEASATHWMQAGKAPSP